MSQQRTIFHAVVEDRKADGVLFNITNESIAFPPIAPKSIINDFPQISPSDNYIDITI